MGDPFPLYVMWILPVLYFGFIVALIAWALLSPRRSRRGGEASGHHRKRPESRWSSDDDIWISSYLSDLEREQHHGGR